MAGACARAVNNTSLPHQLWQLGDVAGDTSGFVAREHALTPCCIRRRDLRRLLAPVDVRIDVWITVVHVRIDVTIIDIGIAGIVRPGGGAADPSVYTRYSVLSIGSVKRQRRNCIGPM
jgi:hypothetical protein